MVVKKNTVKKKEVKAPAKEEKQTKKAEQTVPAGQKVSESDIKQMEKLTVQRVNNTLKVIENALETWDASQSKPQDLFPRVVKLKEFHNALTEWNRKMQQTREADVDTKVGVLREFVDICYRYE